MKKIGVAIKDNGKRLEHFGICEYFIIYNYNESDSSMEYENVIFSSKDHRPNGEEWEKSADAIKDCDIVICEKIGLVARAEIERMGIKIIESEGSVEKVLDKFISSNNKQKNIKF
ncbi:MAG: hypothetical protein BZ138_04635 [Methanosphaera sp. rholeuAM270]|nr:MAG: hypothetical protein BZ138_04635 [Methanosphaera sp. rholeuAM270]